MQRAGSNVSKGRRLNKRREREREREREKRYWSQEKGAMKPPLISKPGFFLSTHLLLTCDRLISGSAYLSHTLDYRHRHDLFYRYGAFLLLVHHCGRYNALFIYAKTVIFTYFCVYVVWLYKWIRWWNFCIFVANNWRCFLPFSWEQAIWLVASEKGREHVRDNCEATPTLRWEYVHREERYERCFSYQTERKFLGDENWKCHFKGDGSILKARMSIRFMELDNTQLAKAIPSQERSIMNALTQLRKLRFLSSRF